MSFAGLTQTRQATLDVSGGATATFIIDRPMEIVRWGFITTTTALTTANTILTMNVEEADESVTDPTGVAAGGTLTIVYTTSGLLNNGCYVEAESFAAAQPLTVVPGEELTIDGDSGADAGAGIVFIEFRPLPWQNPTRPTADPGAVQRATQLAAMNLVTA